MRSKKDDLNKDIQVETINTLFLVAEEAQNKKEIKNFLKGVLTDSEQLMLGRRLLISRMLLSGLPQTEIRFRLRVSPNTVWKVNKWLVEQLPEYGDALKKVEKEKGKREKSHKKHKPSYRYYDPFSLDALKKRYPAHFLLFNIADEILRRNRR